MKIIVYLLLFLSLFLLVSCSHKRHAAIPDKENEMASTNIEKASCRVEGKVTFGPLRPVEREGMPKADTAQIFKNRSVLIYSANPKTIIKQLPLSENGTFEFSLSPGQYIIDMKLRFPERAPALPKVIQLKDGDVFNFDIDINTGLQ